MNASTNPVFAADETHGRVLRPGNRLLVDSQDAGWRSLHAAIFQEVGFEAKETPLGHPSFIYHRHHPARVTRKIEGGPRNQELIGPRRMCLTPGDATAHWSHNGEPEILQVYLRGSMYQAAVSELYNCDVSKAEIVPRFAMVDPLLEQLALAITAALWDGTVEDGLYVDTLAQMIAVHLARVHSSQGRPPRTASSPSMQGARMRRVKEYIEEHLDGDLRLEAMAAEVGVNPVYFARSFREAVGESPHRYVLQRRVKRAKELLRNTEMSVVEVALAAGFSSQSHLSHWFQRYVGVSPAAYRGHRATSGS